MAREQTLPDDERIIDIGYRGRSLMPYMGRGAQEKAQIGLGFRERASGSGLVLDIEVDEESRIYGSDWLQFVANCRAMLGVEAGASVFDLDDVVRSEYERLLASDATLTFEQLSERVLTPWENNVYYRTISPRHFEAAALGVCQILFDGRYSGALEPMEHYIPLAKNFSNFDEVLARFRDPSLRRTLADNAYRDLVASGTYSYRRFIESFDETLLAAGLQPGVEGNVAARVTAILDRDRKQRAVAARIRDSFDSAFPGRSTLRRFKPARELYRRWRYRHRRDVMTRGADQ
jgi:hypothetical protein